MARSKAAVAAPVAVAQVAVAATYPTTEELVAQGLTTKSDRIRKLHELGMSTGAIAKQETNGLYQHAYNVIKKELKRPVAAAAPKGSGEAVQEEA